MKNQEPPAEIIAFLADIGATQTPHHAGRSLTSHLIETWKILTDWQQADPVCIAGLCHSLYGTDAFDTACLGPDDRTKVRKVIGTEAEQISYLFGAMHRSQFLSNPYRIEISDRFTGKILPITSAHRSALSHILLANELDLVIAKKGSGRPEKVTKKVEPIFSVLEPELSSQAKSSYKTLSQGR